MTREIKFRAWNGEKMILPNDFHRVVFDNGKIYGLLTRNEGMDVAISMEIMQYTGLRDINNKEIYEHDIVKFTTFDGIDVVIYLAPRFKTTKHELQGYPCEVIGNVYENKSIIENLINK